MTSIKVPMTLVLDWSKHESLRPEIEGIFVRVAAREISGFHQGDILWLRNVDGKNSKDRYMTVAVTQILDLSVGEIYRCSNEARLQALLCRHPLLLAKPALAKPETGRP